MRAAGGNFKNLNKWAEIHGVALPNGSNISGMIAYNIANRKPDVEIFVENSTYNNRTNIKKRLLAMGWQYVCRDCGVGDTYNGLPLVLQLEHVNGVWNDNRMENLAFLCPNCHSQTSTFSGRARRPKRIKEKIARPTKIDWPPLDVVRLMVQRDGYSATGRTLGVSDNAVRKHIKQKDNNGNSSSTTQDNRRIRTGDLDTIDTCRADRT